MTQMIPIELIRKILLLREPTDVTKELKEAITFKDVDYYPGIVFQRYHLRISEADLAMFKALKNKLWWEGIMNRLIIVSLSLNVVFFGVLVCRSILKYL